MNNYSCYEEAVTDLHQRGYKNDFILFGSDLLWIQQKIFIRCNDFCILECHHLSHPMGQMEDLVVLGVVAVSVGIKGILLNHYSFTSGVQAVIVSKLRSMPKPVKSIPLPITRPLTVLMPGDSFAR